MQKKFEGLPRQLEIGVEMITLGGFINGKNS